MRRRRGLGGSVSCGLVCLSELWALCCGFSVDWRCSWGAEVGCCRGVGVDIDSAWGVAVELEKPLHGVRGRAPVAEGRGRSDRGGQAHQRASRGHDFHLGAHPRPDDRHARHDPTPSPESEPPHRLPNLTLSPKHFSPTPVWGECILSRLNL